MNLQQYSFEGQEVRIQMIEGEPWFCAQDICSPLDLKDVSMSLSRLDSDEKRLFDMAGTNSIGISQNRKMWFISESGLWALVLTSRKPAAKRLSKWLRSEVIPAIRKTGVYASSPQALQAEYARQMSSDPLVMVNQLRELCDVVEKQQGRIAEMAPKAELHDAVMETEGLYTVGQIAKMLGFTGQNRLFKVLREQGVLQGNNEPYQRFVDSGDVVVRPTTLPSGGHYVQPMFTPKGLALVNRSVANAAQKNFLLSQSKNRGSLLSDSLVN